MNNHDKIYPPQQVISGFLENALGVSGAEAQIFTAAIISGVKGYMKGYQGELEKISPADVRTAIEKTLSQIPGVEVESAHGEPVKASITKAQIVDGIFESLKQGADLFPGAACEIDRESGQATVDINHGKIVDHIVSKISDAMPEIPGASVEHSEDGKSAKFTIDPVELINKASSAAKNLFSGDIKGSLGKFTEKFVPKTERPAHQEATAPKQIRTFRDVLFNDETGTLQIDFKGFEKLVSNSMSQAMSKYVKAGAEIYMAAGVNAIKNLEIPGAKISYSEDGKIEISIDKDELKRTMKENLDKAVNLIPVGSKVVSSETDVDPEHNPVSKYQFNPGKMVSQAVLAVQEALEKNLGIGNISLSSKASENGTTYSLEIDPKTVYKQAQEGIDFAQSVIQSM